MCGMQPQRCGADGIFENDQACLYQGACAPGAVEDDLSRCGHLRRLCSDGCEWLDWDVVVPQGECNPGENVSCLEGGMVRCNDRCVAPSCTPI